ncbi:MAG: hypothetical protein Q7R32_07930 [Dehalococcoidia bacterium]|nr:hypothetical protein [Dehalococcoidia bacterium]
MNDRLLRGFWRYMAPIPRMLWQRQVSRRGEKIGAGLGFMSEEHHRVRNFVVRELPGAGEPLSPRFIGERLDLPIARVEVILDDLEKHMTFLFRNDEGAVVWAYPVTVDTTPHHVTFGSGEQVYSA